MYKDRDLVYIVSMSKIQDRVAEIEELVAAVRAHCMTARFEETAWKYRAIFPEGDFTVSGVQVDKELGKAKALRIMLEKLEFYWQSSFPGYVHQ